MPLNMDDKARIHRLAGQMAARYARRPSAGIQLARAPVTANNGDGTLCVNLQGAAISIPCTTAATTAKPGDTILALVSPGVTIAIGIMATAS